MGIEFLNRSRKTIVKRIDQQRVALATPELFTVNPGTIPRSFLASVAEGASVVDGESLIAEVCGQSVKMRRGHKVVLSIEHPTCDVVTAIASSGGIAHGVVKRVHRLSGKADVTFC